MRHLLVILLCLASFSATAEDPFACVNPDVRAAFLPGASYMNIRQNTYSDQAPETFVQSDLPGAFTLVGSEQSEHGVRVAYMVEEAPKRSMEMMASALEAVGFSALDSRMQMTQGGFRSSEMPLRAEMCAPEERRAWVISVVPNGNRSLVSLQSSARGNRCAVADSIHAASVNEQGLALAAPVGALRGGARTAMPTLTAPSREDVSVQGIGMGGGGAEFSARMTAVGPISMGELIAAFSQQLLEQGWLKQSEWKSEISVGSVWRKIDNDERPVVGRLEALSVKPGQTYVTYSLTDLDYLSQRFTQSHSWISSEG